MKYAFATVALALAVFLSGAPAKAQNTRSFVSAQSGVDTNPCSRLSPCRTFARALTLTNAGGEINTLDPGGYGTVTIDRAISIVSGLGEAGVLVPSGATGITINAAASDVVNLRGLIIEGAQVGANGIVFNSGGALTIENSVIRNLTGNGINFAPSASATLAMSNTLVASTQRGYSSGSAAGGILVANSGSGTMTVTLTKVEVYISGFAGIDLANTGSGKIVAALTDSIVTNSNQGLLSDGSGATVVVSGSVFANNNTGVSARAGGVVMLGQSVVTGNSNGWLANGSPTGSVKSYATNQIDGNVTAEAAPPNTVLLK